MRNVSFKIVQYTEGQKKASKGVSAGMWSVVKISEQDVAFADDRGQAEAIKREMIEAAKARGEQVCEKP